MPGEHNDAWWSGCSDSGPVTVDWGLIVGISIGAAGLIVGTTANQINRRTDRDDSKYLKDSGARVTDSKNALDAWIEISKTHTRQIDVLQGRVEIMNSRIEEYETRVVPRLEQMASDQQETIVALTDKIAGCEETTKTLRAALDRLQGGHDGRP